MKHRFRLLVSMAIQDNPLILTVAVMLGAATVACSAGLLGTANYLLAAAALHPGIMEISVSIVGVRFFGIARAVFRYGERYMSHSAVFSIISRTRSTYYNLIEPFAPGLFNCNTRGDVYNSIMYDVEELQDFYLKSIHPAGIAICITIVGSAFFAVFSLKMTVVFIVFFLISVFLIPIATGLAASGWQRRLLKCRNELTETAMGVAGGISEIAAWSRGDDYLEIIMKLSQKEVGVESKISNMLNLVESLHLVLSGAAFLALLYTGYGEVVLGKIPGIAFFALAVAGLSLFEAGNPMGEAFWGRGTAAAERLFNNSYYEKKVQQFPANIDVRRPTQDLIIELQDVWFRYGEKLPWVLQGIDMSIAPGEKKAIIGASGAGKSSLVNIMSGFYPVQHGVIYLSGLPIQQYPADEVHDLMAIAEQTPYLFPASIESNIRLAAPSAAADKMRHVVELVELASLVDGLPGGIGYGVDECGINLSGGEKRRIALARALLKKAPLLVLDEPGAGLDGETEKIILKRILENAGDMSVLLITHRPTCLELMDEIMVLREGQICQRGTLEELVSVEGEFQKYSGMMKVFL